MNETATTFDCSTDIDDHPSGTVAEQLAKAVCVFQHRCTGHSPKAVTVVLSENTLVITLHEALTPAERALANDAHGAAQLQDYHRQLFADSSESLRKEIRRITGRQVRQAAAEVEPTSGSIVHAFSTGTMVQVFLLVPEKLGVLDKTARV